jgi:hypothetical protein
MNLASLAYDMRAAGIKSLAIELADDAPTVSMSPMDRDTMAPPEGDPEPDLPPKDPRLCVALGCTSERGGLFGGVAAEFCREHALAKAGVKR